MELNCLTSNRLAFQQLKPRGYIAKYASISSMVNKQLSTTSFFLRTYFVVIAIIIVAAWLLDNLLASQAISQTDRRDATNLKGAFLFIETQLKSATDAEQKAQVVSQLSQQLKVPFTILHDKDLAYPPSISDELAARQVVILYNDAGEKIYYRKMAAYDGIIAIGPLTKPPSQQQESWIIPLFYSIVAIAILIWSWPLIRDLNELNIAANKFGVNNFTTRLRITKSSAIYPVAGAFNQMAERIQYLISSQKELRNAISHELRTPLSRLKFSLEMMLNKAESPVDADHIRSMKLDIDEIDELIEELLNYAKVETDTFRLNIESLDIDNWLKEQLDSWQRRYPGLSITMELPNFTDQRVDFEAHLMARALSNLIRNAERYADGKVIVRLSLTDTECCIAVNDNGPGIPASDRKKIFTAFTRLETSRAKATGGYGLGLAIVKRIIERHGGTINVSDSTLGGACFVLRWPRTALSEATL